MRRLLLGKRARHRGFNDKTLNSRRNQREPHAYRARQGRGISDDVT